MCVGTQLAFQLLKCYTKLEKMINRPDLLNPSQIIIQALEDKKADDLQIIDVHDLTSVCDEMIVTSGNSTQKIRALAENVMDAAKKNAIEILGVEGMDHREWILIDLGSILVHIMLPELRQYYELEKLWSVKM